MVNVQASGAIDLRATSYSAAIEITATLAPVHRPISIPPQGKRSYASPHRTHTVYLVPTIPNLTLERSLLAEYASLVALDEVGRGAAAGPVSVGAVLMTAPLLDSPPGVRDSKILSPKRRLELVEPIRAWAPSSVGHASPHEVDEFGIILALTIAARRAVAGLTSIPAFALVDGDIDWVNPPSSLFLPSELVDVDQIPFRTVVRGDAHHTSIAAASVLAKVARDAMMRESAELHPTYGWDSNKGYLSPQHIAAIRKFGLTDLHRRSWSYPLA